MADLHGRIDNDFSFHPATAAKEPKHDRIRRMCRSLAHELAIEVPEGREQSLMLTKLEEAMMWANAGIAREMVNQDSFAAMTPTPDRNRT